MRVDPLFQASDPARTTGAYVTFEPGARAAWHKHPLLAGGGAPAGAQDRGPGAPRGAPEPDRDETRVGEAHDGHARQMIDRTAVQTQLRPRPLA